MKYLAIGLIILAVGMLLKRYTDELLRKAYDYKGWFDFLSYSETRAADFLSPISIIMQDYVSAKENPFDRIKGCADVDGSSVADKLRKPISESSVDDEDKERLNDLFSSFGIGHIDSILKKISREKNHFETKSTQQQRKSESTSKAVWIVFSAGAAMLFIMVI
jgi:hypothetical protein